MKATATIALLVASSAALFAEDPVSPPLQSVPKNLARQHYGSNLFAFNTSTQRYVATEAAAAWLDDDVSTGWPALAGKQHYLLQLAEPQLLTNFALSARPTAGTVTLYTGDEAAAPGEAGWTVAAKDVALADVNHKKLGNALNKTAKYLLIETNIAEPGPIYSLYLYGEKSAATESIVKRPQPVDIRTVAGEFVNNQTSFNLTSIYGKSLVTYANAGGGAGSWQRAIDDNAESYIAIKPTTTEAGLVATIDGSHPISRMSILADASAKGNVDVYLMPEAVHGNKAVSVEGLTPTARLTLDGASGRASADIADIAASTVVLRWTPETAGTALPIRELNTFGDLSLADYEVAGLPATVAQGPGGEGEAAGDGKTLAPIGEGSETADFKGGSGKELLPPVAAGPGNGFRPGGLGFPPRVLSPLLPPDTRKPVSP
jgi:hypothetical protein